ncbi:hypothetical protein MHSWG343_09480 [Candidatus Mycoplasma haematohominis]|uniref:Uncharacterized protein n=1 Tax=Candidatus Mycoplasma haematohominis TaxID=1494318 RepID=A0A478FQY4_9MOLU|nr:hypothetical protein MHSWG343_09480 [Candidatus Mycoplasma haemohominis]
MGKETKDTRNDKAGGAGDGDELEDGLDHASEQAAKLNDQALASLFVEANEEALEKDNPPIRELFIEEKKHDLVEVSSKEPSPEFIKEIYESLSRKEIHHKKLLEEGIPSSRILRFLLKFKEWFNIPLNPKEEVVITPENWQVFSIFFKTWKKKTTSYMNNFSSLTDLYLRKEETSKFIFKRELIFMIIILLFSTPVIALFHKSPYSVNEIQRSFSVHWTNFIFSTAIISLVLALVPLFFFASLWFVNVNHLHKSKYFHIFLFCIFTIAFIFMALSVFNACLYYAVDHKWHLTSPYLPATK